MGSHVYIRFCCPFLAETVTRLRAEHTVLGQKRRRLEQALESHNKEIKSLNQGGLSVT